MKKAKLKPKFVDKKTLSTEQLTNPDYRLKQLQKKYGDKFEVTCSRCHHCR